MTDRHCAYIIILDQDLREDDAQVTLQTLQMIKGVVSVRPVVSEINTLVARARVVQEVREKLYAVINSFSGQ